MIPPGPSPVTGPLSDRQESRRDETSLPRQEQTVYRIRIFRRQRAEKQKVTISSLYTTKRKPSLIFTDRYFLHCTPSRKIFYIFICICKRSLTVFLQKCGFLCGKMQTALRKKHFFCPQGRAELCAQTLTFCHNAGKNGP